MASTRNLQDTINWCSPFLSAKPVYTAPTNEPALTNANIILQTILSPPFSWPWNRVETAPQVLSAGVSDYSIAVPTFGFIERAYLTFAGDPTHEIPNIEPVLGPANAQEKDRPNSIAAQLDDGAGNITFRLLPAPDKAYSLVVMQQKKAALIQSLAGNWSPIPDEMGYIFNHGFLALCLLFDDDPRFQIINARFVASLLAKAQGLSETQRNIFVSMWNAQLVATASDNLRVKQGVGAAGQM